MSVDSTTIARGIFRVLETGDEALARATASPVFHNREASVSPAASSIPGPGGLLASSAWMRFAFSDLRFVITDSAVNGDRVWLRLRMQGTHTGAFVRFADGALDQAVPPTGKAIDFEQIHILTVRDGLVVNHEAVRDDMTMLGQLGVFPPTPAAGMKMLSWKVTGRDKRAAAAVSELADHVAQSERTDGRRPQAAV